MFFFAQRYQKLEFLMTRFLWTCGGGELNSSLGKKGGEEVRDTKIKIKIKSYKTDHLQCCDTFIPSPIPTPFQITTRPAYVEGCINPVRHPSIQYQSQLLANATVLVGGSGWMGDDMACCCSDGGCW